MDITTPISRKTPATRYLKIFTSNFRCMKKVRTRVDFARASSRAASTENGPRRMLVIPIEVKVNVRSAKRTRTKVR